MMKKYLLSKLILVAFLAGGSVFAQHNQEKSTSHCEINVGSQKFSSDSKVPFELKSIPSKSAIGPTFITQNFSLNGLHGTSAACGAGNDHDLARRFTLTDYVSGSFRIDSVVFGLQEGGWTPVPVDVNIYLLDGAMQKANLTLIATTSTLVSSAQIMSLITVPINATIPQGAEFVLEFSYFGDLYLLGNSSGQTEQAYVASTTCSYPGAPDFAGVSDIGLINSHIVMGLYGEEVSSLQVEAISVTNPRCVGSNDGIILLEGSGGSQPYQFSLDSINFKYGSSFSGLAPGDYVVWMKDINGLVAKSDTITVGSAKALLGSLVAKTNPKCINQMNGTLRLEASGGKAPYTFTLPSQGKTNNTGVFKNLGPGVYVPEIRDALGCLLVLDSVFLTAPTEVLFSVFVNQIPNCSQGNTGSIQVVVDQGTGPFNYYLNGELQASAQFDDLGIGTYQIRVEDANGCLSASQEVSLTGPSLIGIANVQTTPAECPFGLGVIQITPSGDTAGVQYSIDGVNFSTSPIFDSLLTGNYTVYVSNLAGCTASQEVLVEQAAGLDVAYTLSQGEDCSNQAPASITFTASNGVPPYAYRMNLNPFQSSPTFDSLPAGTHSFTIIDSRGCALGVGPIEVNPYRTMELAAFVDANPSCASSADGSIVGVVNFGVAPYTYALTGFNDQNTGVFTGVAAGVYYFEVRDSRGCSIGDSLFVSAPSPLSVSLGTVQDLSCFSEGNGIIQAMASGGTAPYTYSLDGQSFVSQPVFGALTRGSYRVTVQDANGCKALSNFVTLSTPSAANVQITVNHVKCYGGNDGRVVLTINGGEGPFTYGESIDGPWFPISNLNNLEAGAFQLYVRDNKGCVTYAGAVEITQPSELALNYTVMPEVSPRSGKIFLNASGGTKPYAYYYFRNGWQGIVGTEISFLAGGDYWLVVQDNRGCTDTAVVNVPSQLSLAEADEAEVTLYPNPSQGRVVLSWDNVKPVRVWVSNAMGQQVFEYYLEGSAESGSVEINHEAWSAGWYVLYWEDDTGLIHPMKWMVQE